MAIIGKTFLSYKNSIGNNPSTSKGLSRLKLGDGVFDEVYKTHSTTFEDRFAFPSEWLEKNLLHAKFLGDYSAGNIDFYANTIEKLLLKRRERESFKWVTLLEIPIQKVEDFKFSYRDYFIKARKEYEYAIVPVSANVEGNYNINNIKSSFDGMFITDKDATYYSLLETKITPRRKRQSTVIETLNREYPIVHSTGRSNYMTGSAKGIFIQYQADTDSWDIESSVDYQDALLEFLCNGNPKILKHEDGRTFLISVVNEPSSNEEGHPDKVSTSFEFVEIGNIDSEEDLANVGMLQGVK